MSERDGYLPGVPCWVDSIQPDPDAAAEFYGALFGWELKDTMPAGSPGKYLIARLRGREVAAISSPYPGAPERALWNTYICVESADQAAERARAAGGSVLEEPIDIHAAGRAARLADPQGATFRLWQPGEHRGAQIVNEHGAVNFNDLHTRDAAGVRPFYKALFGWESMTFAPGEEMWTLPGYGDHLERATPGLRKMFAEYGVPGFEDVVARIEPADASAQPAQWAVTFAVNDTDEIVESAQRLGGELIVAPFDSPWVRSATLADPWGTTFKVNQFKPQRSRSEVATGSSTAGQASA
jgi:predicted enzyme related to lactoylglutathione lyase